MQYTWRNRTRTFFNQMRSRIRRRPQGIDPERTALVLCGTRELNPVTVGILRHFPKFTYVFAGKEGREKLRGQFAGAPVVDAVLRHPVLQNGHHGVLSNVHSPKCI